MAKTTLLCILDGFGIGRKDNANAVFIAKMPNINDMFKSYPMTQIEASGDAVGLMDGQMGNSEVGHINIGAGRVVMQLLPAIEDAVKNRTIAGNFELKKMIDVVRASGRVVHLFGLLSDGGVHSH
ncbi:MAG: 2,3-bisphosphoglycerate-independent phosphoglycerate mutase, partial [Rickettsiales bacterium]|nr:2,3-bisphosphoglycerate-independent phosphoglycerate mutase [Rickettsiales bacterium]